jgi:hypothetical protein
MMPHRVLPQGNRKVRKKQPSRPATISGNRSVAVENSGFAGARFLPFAPLGDFAFALCAASEALDYSARTVIMVWRYGIMTLRHLWLTNTET